MDFASVVKYHIEYLKWIQNKFLFEVYSEIEASKYTATKVIFFIALIYLTRKFRQGLSTISPKLVTRFWTQKMLPRVFFSLFPNLRM